VNREQMVAPFADEELQHFAGRGGKTMTYIEDETVMDRLDAGYGYGNWQVQVEAVPYAEGVVKVRLGVREFGEWLWFEDFGYPNQKDGDVLKESVSDGIRRCGRYVGIARDLYRKRTYEQPAKRPAKADDQRPPGEYSGPPNRPELVRTTGNDGLIGKVATSGTQDFNLRETPDGPVLPFRIKEGNKAGQIVIAHGAMATLLAPMDLIGQRVTVWGRYSDEESPKPDGYVVHYKVLHLERISTPEFVFPAPDAPAEAESVQLFEEAPPADDPELMALEF